MSHGEFDSAVTEFKKAMRSKKNSIAAPSWLGMAYERLGDHLFKDGETDRAIDSYRNALVYVPEDPYWHENLGLALENKGEREAALKEYSAAAELSPLDDGLQSKVPKPRSGPPGLVDATNSSKNTQQHYWAVGGGVSAPIPIFRPEPPYAERARQAKLQGTVVLWIIIDAEGNVPSAKVMKPLGLGLEAKALEAVRTWKFQPSMHDGVAVPVGATVEVSFKPF